MTHSDPTLSDELWRTVQAAPPVRAAHVRAGRERLRTGNWPTALQLADCLLTGWVRRLVLRP